MTTRDGGPAFPVETYELRRGGMNPPTKVHNAGMSLRDWFAGQAVQGLVSQSIGSALTSDLTQGARWAYNMADALLVAREEPRS